MNCFSEVLDIQRRRHTDSKELRISDILFNMGNIYVELNQPEKALHCLDQSYSITKEALGNHKELHSTMYLIGVAWSELEELENALEWFTSALSVLETKTEEEAFLDADEAARGRTLYRLGQVCEQLGDNQKALSCFQDCAKILKVTRSNDLEMSNALFSMGNLLLYSSDYDRALSCYDQSLRIRIEIGDEVMVTKIKHSIGLALSDVGELNRALAFLADVLRTFSKQQGAISVDTGKLLMSVGQNYLNQGLHSLAMNYFEAAVSVIEADQDSALDTAVCLYSIGVIQDSSSDEGSIENYRQAISLFNDGKESAKSHFLAMPMQKYDSVLASCLHSAAKFYAKKDNHSEALRYMSEAFELKKEIFGLDHESTAASQHWLGAINLALEEDELALMNFKGSLKIRVSLFGTEHKDVAATLYGLAEVHFKRDELAECLECINENLRISSRLGSEDSVLSRSKLMLGSCYQELGQYEQAKEHLSESLRMLISVHGGERHLDVADAHFRLGICYCETTEYEKSLVHFKSCLSTRSHMLGNLDLECANTYESLGIVQQKMNSHQDALSSFERALAIKRTSLPEVDEDISVLLHFIGTSLFAIEKYDDSLHYFSSSADIKKQLHGDGDQEYAMSLLDKAAALEKIGDVRRSVECYSESIESRALPLDSWELGIAHKSMARYFHSQNNIGSSFDSYNEAISIFEWIMESESSPSVAQYEDVIECYVRLLDIGDEPISEDRGTTCYKLANCYVQAGKMKGK
jgi:tetratricopeptide (TPR) repeat protein